MPKAYSYVRFSTPEQSKGDSLRRQTELSRQYAKRHDLDLDESLNLRDLGISAFKGKNAQEGALGAFLKAVDSGLVRKGSYLLVENLDRLSRDTVRRAFDQFTGILERGVNIVTLADNKVYNGDAINENFGDLMVSLTAMFRAHEESLTKSKRISAAWKGKRDMAQSEGRKLTARCPAWLTLDRAKNAFVVDKDRAKVVRRVFEMALTGHGKAVIARRFNSEGVPTFGASVGWHPSYIQKILESEAVCGMFQPMRIQIKDGKRQRVPDGEPLAGYFPAIVDRPSFERARRSRSARRIPAGRKGQTFTNLFTGLIHCGNCNSPMHYVNKGQGSKGGAYLVCSNARRAVSNCKARAWKYEPAETFLVLCIEELNYEELFPEIAGSSREALAQLENTKLEQEATLARAKRQLDNIVNLLIESPDQPTLKGRLPAAQEAYDTMTVAMRALDSRIEDERERAKTAENDFRQTQDGLELLNDALAKGGQERYDVRSRLHQLLKRTIKEVTMHASDSAIFAPLDASEWYGAVDVRFHSTNNARMLYIKKDLKSCHSIPVRNGKANMRKAVTLTARQ